MTLPEQLNMVLANLPESPGIYKFYDSKDRLLYIGKSKNLKSRVRSYFRKQRDETMERTLIMINNIDKIEIETTETELEALILEDTLIKQYLPPYNVKQKKFREQVYIAVSSEKFPAFKILANEQLNFHDQSFGPFKDKYAAENILYTLKKILKLRSCTEPIPVRKCMLAGIGKCLGPCLDQVTAEEYEKLIIIALDFLNGNYFSISRKIDEQIAKAAIELEFEEAAKLRDLKDFCANFCQRQEFMQDFIHRDLIIHKGKHNFIFRKGYLIKVYKQNTSDTKVKNSIISSKKKDKINIHHLMDRSYVVWVWLKQNKAKYRVL